MYRFQMHWAGIVCCARLDRRAKQQKPYSHRCSFTVAFHRSRLFAKCKTTIDPVREGENETQTTCTVLFICFFFVFTYIDFICSIWLECKNICPSVTAYRGTKKRFVDFWTHIRIVNILTIYKIRSKTKLQTKQIKKKISHKTHGEIQRQRRWFNTMGKIFYFSLENVYRRWKIFFSWQSFTNELRSVRKFPCLRERKSRCIWH